MTLVTPHHRAQAGTEQQSAAEVARPLVAALVGDPPPLRFVFWDGSELAPSATDHVGTVTIHTPDAIRRMLWAPGELGLGRAHVAGEIELDGDIVGMIERLRDAIKATTGGTERVDLRVHLRTAPKALAAARQLGAIGRPLPPPAEEAHLSGWRHSLGRDARAISHHYDVGNDFYRLVLGPSMTYSCARFVDEASTLEDAQASKHELICRKLGLHERPGARLLDVGCGWGSLAIHAATHHGASVVGITISEAQAALARQRVTEAGVADRVEIRLQDYRELGGETFDAISSIGMFEHVGAKRTGEYFDTLRNLLHPHGRLLNHAISSVGGSKLPSRSFVGRYVFPDGELIDVGEVVLAMQQAGFEVRDVESLREHYARTLRCWVRNLEERWDDAVREVGAPRARVWRLYMAGSVVGFEDGGIGLHQVLGVVPDQHGASNMPRTRDGWATG